MPKALITGHLGFIGSKLFRRLYEEGWDLDGVDNLTTGTPTSIQDLDFQGIIRKSMQANNAEVTSHLQAYEMRLLMTPDDRTSEITSFIDDCDSELILAKIKNKQYDVIFHLAANPSIPYSTEYPLETTDVNLMTTIKILNALRESPATRLVFSSSSAVYGDADLLPTNESSAKKPKSLYALQKSASEDFIRTFCELYNLDAVSLRYFNVFGPGQKGNNAYCTAVASWTNAIFNNQMLRSDGDGTQTRDLCYVDNVVSANYLAATSSKKFRGDVYNIASGKSISNNDILSYLATQFPTMNVKHAPERIGDVKHTHADIDKARRELSYKPTVDFWEGLKRTIAWWDV